MVFLAMSYTLSVLAQFEIQPKMKQVMMNLNSELTMKTQFCDSYVEIDFAWSLKQGCTMGPIVYLTYLYAGSTLSI